MEGKTKIVRMINYSIKVSIMISRRLCTREQLEILLIIMDRSWICLIPSMILVGVVLKCMSYILWLRIKVCAQLTSMVRNRWVNHTWWMSLPISTAKDNIMDSFITNHSIKSHKLSKLQKPLTSSTINPILLKKKMVVIRLKYLFSMELITLVSLKNSTNM